MHNFFLSISLNLLHFVDEDEDDEDMFYYSDTAGKEGSLFYTDNLSYN